MFVLASSRILLSFFLSLLFALGSLIPHMMIQGVTLLRLSDSLAGIAWDCLNLFLAGAHCDERSIIETTCKSSHFCQLSEAESSLLGCLVAGSTLGKRTASSKQVWRTHIGVS